MGVDGMAGEGGRQGGGAEGRSLKLHADTLLYTCVVVATCMGHVATRLLPYQGDVHGAMAAGSGHGYQTGALRGHYSLNPSLGWQNALQKSRPVQ